VYPTAFDQGKELTQLRKQAEWINDVPRHVCVSILDRLEKAWEKCFCKICKRPKWKKRKDHVSFKEFDSLQFYVRGNKLKFPKLPLIPIVMSRTLEGKPKSCTIKRDGDQWFACIMCEVDIGTPEPRIESPIGIDRGVRNMIADSNDRIVNNPKFLNKSLRKLARAQKSVSRKVQGSKNKQKAYNKVSRIHRTIRRQREHFIHVESTHYTKSHGIVVLEDLKTKNMIRVGGGLSRSIGDSGWGIFARFLAYKLQWSGGNLYEVPAHYTSQTCFACNHVDRASRIGDRFKCTKCGHTDHADTNGAKIVLARWSPACQPVEGSSQRAPRRSRKSKSNSKEV
jgi:putative transposase